MKLFITGIAGFIGSNLAREAVAQGFQVSGIDDFATGAPENLRDIKDKITVHNGSILNAELLAHALAGVDYVLHQAAIPSVPRSIKDPILTSKVNVMGTLTVLHAAHKAKVKRVILASSSSVYGDTPTLPKHEGMKLSPLSPYAVSKLTNELHAAQFYGLYGLETICLRYFNVFGPYQSPISEYAAVIPKFISQMLKNKQPVIYGDGTQSRDFTYIKDVVAANLGALRAPQSACGKSFNIAGGKQVTLNELIHLLNTLLKKNIKPVYEKQRVGDIKHSYADISLAKEHLKYAPHYSLEQGLEETIDWYSRRV